MNAIRSEAVKMWSLHAGMPSTTESIAAPLIDNNENYVRLFHAVILQIQSLLNKCNTNGSVTTLDLL
jgi:hypothetical protein